MSYIQEFYESHHFLFFIITFIVLLYTFFSIRKTKLAQNSCKRVFNNESAIDKNEISEEQYEEMINEDVNKYQVTAPIQNGNSWGPLFDYSGNVVGVIESRLDKEKYSSENVNYAVKVGLLKNIVDLIPKTTKKVKGKKTSSLSQVDKIKLFSDYVVMIQTY